MTEFERQVSRVVLVLAHHTGLVIKDSLLIENIPILITLLRASSQPTMPQKIPGSGAEPQTSRKLFDPLLGNQRQARAHGASQGRPFIMRNRIAVHYRQELPIWWARQQAAAT